jgi:tripartite-type tricarboxylate transporter receptor subunit TctC
MHLFQFTRRLASARAGAIIGTTISAISCAVMLATTAPASAQSFPNKPLTLYVGFAPGGAADTVARVLADEMSKALGQPVIVDNRSGASGNIATQAVLSAPADGQSLLFAAIFLATNPAMIGVKYNPATDLTMVSQVTAVPVVMLASNASGLQQGSDVADAAKKMAGGLRVGSGGIGTSSHLAMELLKREQNIPLNHIPYRGGAPANKDLMSGEIDLMFDLMSGSLKGLVDGGRVRPLAVMQATRLPALPDVKSAKELGFSPATYIRSWQGIAVRSGTPDAVVKRLYDAVITATNSPAFRTKAEQLGSDVVTSKTPAEFQQYYASELTRWAQLIKAANIKAE